MMPHDADRNRLMELLADRSGGEPLGHAERAELDELLDRFPDIDPDSFERTTAAIHLALLGSTDVEMPAELRDRLVEQADAFFAPGAPSAPSAASPSSPAPTPPVPSSSSVLAGPWPGWIAAAAAVLFLLLRGGGPPPPEAASYGEVIAARDSVSAPWAETGDPDGVGVTGEVVWSDELQMGYMTFRGLPENDPGEGQYQLWIFDPARPAEYPVDGGVFDAVGGEVRVPIDAKIGVSTPNLFAITYEQPGGVVVSTRERLLLTASVNS